MKTKEQKKQYYDTLANQRHLWRVKNWYYYTKIEQLLAHLISSGKRILEIGCGTGELLDSLTPSVGVGVDFSRNMLAIAATQFPEMCFIYSDAELLDVHEVYDYVILVDLVGELADVWQTFHELRSVTDEHSRIVITNYNYLWEPILRIGEKIGLKMPQDYQNWLSRADIANILTLNDIETIKCGHYMLCPIYIPLLSNFLNRYIAILPIVKNLCMVQYVVAKTAQTRVAAKAADFTVSVIIPCRNEMGNIEAAVERVPKMGKETEIIFVDGESTDGTVEKISQMILKYKADKNIRLIHQTSTDSQATPKTSPNKMLKLGKGDAVRKGFDAATGDILMILDADLTVPPEELPKFYHAIASGKGEFINGTRLVYQMEKQAMRTLNIAANKLFSLIFTWLLGQPIKDTLCGTKVLFRKDYEIIKKYRSHFGNFDPFGDFDLLFGAAKQNLKIVEVPVHYQMRIYGDVKIERFKHGLQLLKMSWIGFTKLKLFG